MWLRRLLWGAVSCGPGSLANFFSMPIYLGSIPRWDGLTVGIIIFAATAALHVVFLLLYFTAFVFQARRGRFQHWILNGVCAAYTLFLVIAFFP